MILKSYIIEKNIEALKAYRAVLIYGENTGIRKDIKEKIKESQSKNTEILTFFEEDILKKNTLYESLINESLFSEKKIILIQESSDKIYDEIIKCLEIENYNIKIYIFSKNLEKKSKLRNWFEKNKDLATLPCYKDNERTLINYISNELKGLKGLTGEMINAVITNSNMDRGVIKNELVKIKYFFMEKRINKGDLLEILNIKDDSGFDEIRDKALMGEHDRINKLLSETEILNEETFYYLNNLNNRILRLYEIIMISDGNKNNYEKILETLKPPIFWKDRPIILQQLKKWCQKKLEEIISKISETEILMKKNSYLRNDIIFKDLIIKITKTASTTY